MSRFEVVYEQSGAPEPTIAVVSKTRRWNGAVNEADRYLQDAYDNMKLHCDDNRVTVGPLIPMVEGQERYDWMVVEIDNEGAVGPISKNLRQEKGVMPALATINDFVCGDWSCSRVATQFRTFYGSRSDSKTKLENLKSGLLCNIHAGGLKRRWQGRWSSRNEETLTMLTDLGPEWDAAKAEYISERKAANEAAHARMLAARKQAKLENEARLAQAWVERSIETEPDITPGTDYSSYDDTYRDGFTIGTGHDSWRERSGRS